MTILKSRKLISLFTGAGGLDLGLEAAGFKTSICVEVDDDCRKTLRINKCSWKLAEPGDIHKISPEEILSQAGINKRKQLEVLAGGPPCQPFSKSGYWSNGDTKRLVDPRAKTLKAFIEMVEMALPEVILLENVKGLIYEGKDEGLRYLLGELKRINRRNDTKYRIHVMSINCSHFGVPQIRERVFLLASKHGLEFSTPSPIDYLTEFDEGENHVIRTAWDAIGDLDTDEWEEELNPRGKWADLLPCIPEGKNYLWHTPRAKGRPIFGWRTRYWSFLLKLKKDKPSWTIQAMPGPATGPFHWRSRHLSIRELARLQTFPDSYRFYGNYRSIHRQIGNAVPPAISYLLGIEIRKQFFSESLCQRLKFIPLRNSSFPKPERVKRVPKRFVEFEGNHKDHPGTGLGPRGRGREELGRQL